MGCGLPLMTRGQIELPPRASARVFSLPAGNRGPAGHPPNPQLGGIQRDPEARRLGGVFRCARAATGAADSHLGHRSEGGREDHQFGAASRLAIHGEQLPHGGAAAIGWSTAPHASGALDVTELQGQSERRGTVLAWQDRSLRSAKSPGPHACVTCPCSTWNTRFGVPNR